GSSSPPHPGGRGGPAPFPTPEPHMDYDLLPLGEETTPYRLLTQEHVSTTKFEGRPVLKVDPACLERLAFEAMKDIAHYFRPSHLSQLRKSLDGPLASPNDKFVALDLLKNACISAGGVLPSCQDTGTAIVT